MIPDNVRRFIVGLGCAVIILGIASCASSLNNQAADTRDARNTEIEQLQRDLAKTEAERDVLSRALAAATQGSGASATGSVTAKSSEINRPVAAGQSTGSESSPGTPPASVPTAAATTPLDFTLAIEDTLDRLIADIEKSKPPEATQANGIMIDPLIDGNTGVRTVATESMGKIIARRIQSYHPQFMLKPFERASLKDKPLLLIGTLTAINGADNPQARNDVYRICLALVDLGTGKVLGRAWGRATEQSVDGMPVAFYADAPTWDKDDATDGYIRTCQEITAAMPADPTYLDHLPVSMLINEAQSAYNNRRYSEAKSLYRSALSMTGGDQIRTITGLYLSNWKLKRTDEAAQAFDQLVGHGLKEKKLALKMLFEPNSVAFVNSPDLRAQYALWIPILARRVVTFNGCLQVVGHTSRSGSNAANLALSERRASTIRSRLSIAAPPLADRISTRGVGSQEAIVGTGTDDARDAVDRRVEFRVAECGI